jgi:hypothetical protein
MSDTQLFPAWKEAVRRLLDDGMTYGSTVKRKYLVELCGVRPPENIEDVRRYDLEVLKCITEIKEIFLTAHCMLLASDHAGNYVVVAPESQTQYAIDTGVKAITKEMKKMAMNVSFTKTELLTDTQRAKNSDAQAKISMLAGMMNKEQKDLKRIAGVRNEID